MVTYIYIDESGDMGLKGSNYFIISAIIVFDKEIEILKKVVKKARANKFHKLLKNKNEIKSYQLPKNVIEHFLNKLNKLNIKSYSIALNKNQIPQYKLKNNQKEIRLDMISQLINCIPSKDEKIVIIDKFIKKSQINKFNKNLISLLKDNKIRSINHYSSLKFIPLQFADIIAGTCFKHFEKEESKLLNIISRNHVLIHYKK
jgi:hypothetical protein